jgi:hypothetical protein
MMEWWNIGMLFSKGNISLINSLFNRNNINKPLFQFPRTHYFYPVKLSPIFTGAIIPIFQYSNWGEAPKF